MTQAKLSEIESDAFASLLRMKSTPIDPGRGQRIRYVREAFLEVTQERLAEMMDVERGAVGNWETGKGIGRANLNKLVELSGVSMDWISRGTGPKPVRDRSGGDRAKIVTTFDPDAAADEDIDETKGVADIDDRRHRRRIAPGSTPEMDLLGGASYGGGYALPTEVTDDGGRTYSADVVKAEWTFPPSWLRDEMRLALAATDVVSVAGPSMSPDLNDGDRVLVDRRHRDPRQGGIFVVRDGDGIIIKHVELVRNGDDPPRIRCISANKTYTPFELVLDGVHVAIIGRVAAKISRM